MLTTLKMVTVAAVLIVLASTALAQRTPIDSQSLTVPLNYSPAALNYSPAESVGGWCGFKLPRERYPGFRLRRSPSAL